MRHFPLPSGRNIPQAATLRGELRPADLPEFPDFFIRLGTGDGVFLRMLQKVLKNPVPGIPVGPENVWVDRQRLRLVADRHHTQLARFKNQDPLTADLCSPNSGGSAGGDLSGELSRFKMFIHAGAGCFQGLDE